MTPHLAATCLVHVLYLRHRYRLVRKFGLHRSVSFVNILTYYVI